MSSNNPDIGDTSLTLPNLLEEDQSLFQSIYLHCPLGLAFSDVYGNIIGANEKYCLLLGYKKEELLAMTFAQITPIEVMKAEVDGVRKAIKSGAELFRIEKPMIHKEGHLVWGDISMTIVRNQDTGAVKFLIAMITNITEKVKIQQALEESEANLKKQNQELEQIVYERTEEIRHQNIQLQNSNKDLESFAYAASHDLKEPLRTVGGFASLFHKRYYDTIDDTGKEYLEFIVNGVNRMNHLIHSILDYSKVNQKEADMALIQPNSILSNKIQDLQQSISESSTLVTIYQLPQTIYGNAGQLGIVFHNLISNGIKFNQSDSPSIEISSSEDDHYWYFQVKDNGIGFDPQYKDHIFKLFKRLHGKSDFEGSGVGLALCYKIVKKHGGTFQVESSPGKGSTFQFSIVKQTLIEK